MPQLSLSAKLVYGAGSLGTGLFSSVTGVLLLFYMTQTLGIAAAAAGLALFMPKAWDILFDPLVGSASDRYRSRWGRRQPFLVVGALLTSIGFGLLFSTPELQTPAQRLIYAGVAFFVAMTGYALFCVPYAAMPAEMSHDPNERTAIMSFRMGFMLAGTMIGSVLGPFIVSSSGGGREGYGAMALWLGGLMCLAMLTTAACVQRLPSQEAQTPSLPLSQQVAGVLAQRDYLFLLMAYVLVLVGNGTMAAAAPYFVVHVLGREAGDIGSVFGSLLIAAILVMPLWVWAARRWGKRMAAVASFAVFGSALLLLSVLGARLSPAGSLTLFALAGVGFAGSQLVPFSLLTDVIQADRANTGLHREGSFTGLFIAGEKTGLALGPLFTGLLLDWGGFVASATAESTQAEGVSTFIALAFGALPGLACFVAAIVLLMRPSLSYQAIQP
ncbi:MAG: MFS transporter [Limnohabitans sp.]